MGLDRIHRDAAEAAERLRTRWKDPVRITIIVRNLADPTGERDVVVTDDDIAGIQSAVNSLRGRIR